MKIFNLFIIALFVGLFVGCTANNNSVSTVEKNKQKNCTSKQIEKKINWKYCEQRTY